MIVIGVDVHKHSLTAVAVDEVGRPLRSARCRSTTASSRGRGRSARSGCGRWRTAGMSTRGLERALVAAGERLVRVPPRLTAPQRRRGRTRGKSDGIDALAVARAALQEPQLDGPRPARRRCGS